MRGILIDSETGDLLIGRGRMTVGDTESQTVELVLRTSPGEWKEHPLLGADAVRQLGGTRDVMWPGRTKAMLRACGVDVREVKVSDNEVIIS